MALLVPPVRRSMLPLPLAVTSFTTVMAPLSLLSAMRPLLAVVITPARSATVPPKVADGLRAVTAPISRSLLVPSSLRSQVSPPAWLASVATSCSSMRRPSAPIVPAACSSTLPAVPISVVVPLAVLVLMLRPATS